MRTDIDTSTLDRAIDTLDAARRDRKNAGATDAADRAAFLERYPFPRFYADLQHAVARHEAQAAAFAEPPRPSLWARLVTGWGGPWPVMASAAVAVAVVTAIMVGPTSDGGETPQVAAPWGTGAAGVRLKGAESPAFAGSEAAEQPVGLRFFVRGDVGVVPGQLGGMYRPGDQIRFTYWSGDNDYLILLSLEESGRVSVYYPDEQSPSGAAQSIAIVRGRNIPLEDSIVLNDYIGDERFVALFSPMPLSVEHVREAVTRAWADTKAQGGGVVDLDRLPLDVPQASFWIRKGN